jgi:hypothetical protein
MHEIHEIFNDCLEYGYLVTYRRLHYNFRAVAITDIIFQQPSERQLIVCKIIICSPSSFEGRRIPVPKLSISWSKTGDDKNQLVISPWSPTKYNYTIENYSHSHEKSKIRNPARTKPAIYLLALMTYSII